VSVEATAGSPIEIICQIIRARVPGLAGLQAIAIAADGRLAGFTPMTHFTPADPHTIDVIDVEGDWISLGGVDLQINGALGLPFPELKPADLPKLTEISEILWNSGIDSYLPTIVTTSIANIQRSLGVIRDFLRTNPAPSQAPQAQILGVHLEGPFLNLEKRGAHPPEFLQPLTLDRVQHALGEFVDLVKIITLAPELEPEGEAIAWLVQRGITVSLGHSQATATEAQRAFDQGATMVTHAFNAMLSLHHREPGLLGAAIADRRVMCGFIADGQHVCPTMLHVLLHAAQFDQGLFLVSDALAPLGLPDGVYPWDDRQIQITDGTARLENGTLAGTTRPLLAGVKNLLAWGLCSLEQAIALATIAPRRAIGLPDWEGSRSQLLRWSADGQWTRLVPAHE